MTSKVKISDYIAQRLARVHGVRQVFLVTGGGSMHLNDALTKVDGMDYFCCHHEQACAIAAEGYARVSGRLAVVNVTSGPGGTNALTGVLGQWTDSAPALYLSGQIKQETSIYWQPAVPLRQLGDQEADIMRIVRPITKFAETIRDVRDVRYLLDKAVHLATSGRPGPVWLDVPLDIQGALVDEDELRAYDPAENPVGQDGPERFAQVVSLLMKAQRPVLVAGHGLRIAGATRAFARLLESLKVPVVGTFNGVDAIPTAHPCYIGRIGTIGGRAGNFALQNCDLLLSIGSRNNIRQISYAW
ncbi:MAG TPA: thiamine pyrophosphate-binding protein, partial [bacterium]|nr:thiamine pyrophosphate-binding protein [bacterium]